MEFNNSLNFMFDLGYINIGDTFIMLLLILEFTFIFTFTDLFTSTPADDDCCIYSTNICYCKILYILFYNYFNSNYGFTYIR
jgi:hypothetical protein